MRLRRRQYRRGLGRLQHCRVGVDELVGGDLNAEVGAGDGRLRDDADARQLLLRLLHRARRRQRRSHDGRGRLHSGLLHNGRHEHVLLHHLTHVERDLIGQLVWLKNRCHGLLRRLHEHLTCYELWEHLLSDRLLHEHLLLGRLLLLLVEGGRLEELLHELWGDVLKEVAGRLRGQLLRVGRHRLRGYLSGQVLHELVLHGEHLLRQVQLSDRSLHLHGLRLKLWRLS